MIGSTGAQGATGAVGDTGPQGIQGIQGAQGITGAVGDTGPQGIQGIQGVTGAQGIQGIQGVTGAVGDAGPQGIQGIQGITGATGDTGAQGIQGIQGVTGAVGDTGPQGIQGIQGVTGAIGDTGPQGIQGIQGNTGVVGPTGNVGATGSVGVTGAGYGPFTSNSSNSTTFGSKTFTISSSNFAYTAGSRVRFTSSSTPSDYVEGIITSISGSNITFTVDTYYGPGNPNYTSWNLSIAGSPGATGNTGAPGTNGLQGPTGATGAGFVNGTSAGQVYITGTGGTIPTAPTSLSGDVSSVSAAGAVSLATTGVSAGSYGINGAGGLPLITVDAKGRVTEAANATLKLTTGEFQNEGTTTTVLHGSATGNPTFSKIATGDISTTGAATNNVLSYNGTSVAWANPSPILSISPVFSASFYIPSTNAKNLYLINLDGPSYYVGLPAASSFTAGQIVIIMQTVTPSSGVTVITSAAADRIYDPAYQIVNSTSDTIFGVIRLVSDGVNRWYAF